MSLLKGLLGLVFGAAVLYGLQHTTPYYGDITSPVPFSGKPGQRIDADLFAFNVSKVHVARELATRSYDRVHTYSTSGLWVLVEAMAEAGPESIALTSAQWLGPNGVRYALTQRISGLPGFLPAQKLEPGLPRPVLMAFEVPKDQAAGGTLLVARSAWTPLEPEARVETASLKPEVIHPTLEIGRGDANRPWTLSGMQ